jgi:hypothetical protein
LSSTTKDPIIFLSIGREQTMNTALDLKRFLENIADEDLAELEVAALYSDDFDSNEFDVAVGDGVLEIVGSTEHV